MSNTEIFGSMHCKGMERVVPRNFDEISRRAEVAKSPGADLHPSKRVTAPPNQTYVLVNLANDHHNVKSTKPAFRAIGVFASMSDLMQYTQEHPSPTESVYLMDIRKDWIICRSSLEQVSGVYHKNLVDYVVGKHSQTEYANTSAFRKRVQDTVGDKAKFLQTPAAPAPAQDDILLEKPLSILSENENAEKEEEDDVKDKENTSKPLARELEIRGQNFIVFSTLPNDGQEPLVAIYGAFDTEENAKEYATGGIGKDVTDRDLHVCRMYEWIFPHLATDKNIDSQFRDPELNKIMAAPQEQAAQIEDFERNNPNRILDGGVTVMDSMIAEADGKPIEITRLEEEETKE
jgi:hypothetical protein